MKKAIKKTMFSIFVLFVGMPFYLCYKILFFSSNKSFETISQILSLFPGYFGYFSRQAFYFLSIKSGNNFHIEFRSTLVYPSVRIKDNVYIGSNCQIAKCTIGKNVKIGSNVHIVNKQTHDIDKKGNILPTNIQKLKRINIGEKTWIGNCSVILADVGKKCIIGAGSVVTKPIPDNSVAVGNPARVIKENV